MYIQQLREKVPPQITLLILYYISIRLVNLLKVTDAPIPVPDIFYITVSFKFLNFSFILCLKFLLASCPTMYKLHCFGLDPVPTVFQPASFDLQNLNILHQIMVYAISIRANLDSP